MIHQKKKNDKTEIDDTCAWIYNIVGLECPRSCMLDGDKSSSIIDTNVLQIYIHFKATRE